MKTFSIEFYPELCCDYCNDIIHNHMKCPYCCPGDTVGWPGTSMYGPIYEMNEGESLFCEKCKTEFILIEKIDDIDSYMWTTK